MMAVPPELGGADSYPVSGRQGFVILNPNIRFGSFATDQVRRGITVGSGELEPGLLSSTSKSERHTVTTFSMRGWRGMCEARHESETTTEITGAGVSSEHGAYWDKSQSVTQTDSYRCDLSAKDRRLHLELGSAEGWVLDAAGSTVYRLSSIREAMTMKHPELRGYLIEAGSGGVAAVQSSFDGVVYFSRSVEPKQRAELAVVSVAVLLYPH